MDSALATVGLPIALAVIMFGLGLGLSGEDFRRVGQRPKVIAVALACQLVLLPAVCFGLVVLADLPPVLGIGMMLLAASPGGTTANLMSHLFHGDVALNISLTAVNSIISIVTLPIVTGLAIAYYDRGDEVSVPFGEVLKVFVDHPGAGGDRHARPRSQRRVRRAHGPPGPYALRRPARPARRRPSSSTSATTSRATSPTSASSPRRSARSAWSSGTSSRRPSASSRSQAIASSFEIGLHNGTLAIFIAVEVLGSVTFSVPAAVYSLVMLPLAALWGIVRDPSRTPAGHGLS